MAVLAGLAVLTIVEYIVAKEIDENLIPLMLMALVKAALILWYFMHIKNVTASGGEH
jgi:heme/copper-type cytochrome/quinol oxidase subunit 4